MLPKTLPTRSICRRNACCSIGSACWNLAGVLQELTVAVLLPQKSASEENALIMLRVLWNVLSRMKELYEVGNNARSRSRATKSNEPTRSYVASSFVRSTICGKISALVIMKVWHVALMPAFSSCATLLCMLSINDELAFLFFKMNVLTKTFLPRSGPSGGIPLLLQPRNESLTYCFPNFPKSINIVSTFL